MAFATFHEATNSQNNSPTLSHTVSWPATVNAGDLLLAIVATNANNTLTVTQGFTKLGSNAAGNPGTLEVWGKIAAGTETGTFAVTSSNSQSSAWSIRRYSATSGALVAGTDYDIAAAAAWVASSSTPDPPNVAASWGSDDNTFIAIGGGNGANRTASSAPTNYGNLSSSAATTGGGGGASCYSADRQLVASSDNPGTFTLSGTDRVFAFTLVLLPVQNVTIDLDLPVETDTAPDTTLTGSGSATINLDLPVEVDTAGDAIALVTPPIVPTFPDALLGHRVEMAFGAGADSPLTWPWTDVTDRFLDQQSSSRRGRGDESSQPQPSSTSLELDNGDGALMPGNANSPYWPNVKRGTPLRRWVEGTQTALVLPGVTGSYASTGPDPDFDFAGDFDLRIRVQPDQWAGATLNESQILISKMLTGGDLSWEWAIDGDGKPFPSFSTNGSSTTFPSSIEARIAALRPVWLAMTFDADDGDGGRTLTFYRYDKADAPPADVTTWTLIGATTTTGTGGLFAGNADVELGTNNNGFVRSAGGFRGRMLAAEIRDGINGTVVANPDFTAQQPGTPAFIDAAGKTWFINGDARITTEQIRFVGTVDDLSPDWPFGNHPTAPGGDPTEARVAVTAAGLLRRLGQGAKPLRSALQRRVTESLGPNIVAYWPCEDGQDAAQLASGIVGAAPITIASGVDAASDDTQIGAGSLPTIKAGDVARWSGPVPPPVTFFDEWAVDWIFRLPTPETSPTTTRLLTVDTQGSAVQWRFSLNDTSANLTVVDAAGAELVNNSGGIGSDMFADWVRARLEAFELAGTIFWSWSLTPLNFGVAGGVSSSFAGTIGRITTIGNDTTRPPDGLSFGHIVVLADPVALASGWLDEATTAWVGESAAHRYQRLCHEEAIPVEVIGDPIRPAVGGLSDLGDLTLSEPMGPQGQRTLLELLDECVAVDLGVAISRRRAPGLVYRTRKTLETQDVALTLDADNNEIVAPLEPRLDDQRLRNDVTVITTGGSSARVIDQASIDAEGLYEDAPEIAGVGGLAIQQAILSSQPGLRRAVTTQNLQQAAWRLHLGTWPDLRYPSVATELSIAAHLVEAWHDVELGDRIVVKGLPVQHPTIDVELLLEAIDEPISATAWGPQLTCSPGGPWLVGTLDADTPTTSLARLASDQATTLDAAITAADTSIALSDAVWAAAANQYPLLIDIDGELIRANGVTNAATQTFTGCDRAVNGVTKAHAAGTVVTVAEPFRLSL